MRFLLLLPILFLISCCPKDGVDRSSSINDYILAIDYFNYNTPVNTQLIPQAEISLELMDKNGASEIGKLYKSDNLQTQRLVFFFDQKWNDDLVSELNIKLSGFNLRGIDFSQLQKTAYQKEPINLTSNETTSQFLCFLNNVGHLLLPSANAMSCKAKSGSKITYREGTLIRIDLQ